MARLAALEVVVLFVPEEVSEAHDGERLTTLAHDLAPLDDTDLAEMARSWGYQEARHGTTPTDFAPVARILDAGSLARVELVRSAFLKGMQEAAAGAAAALS